MSRNNIFEQLAAKYNEADATNKIIQLYKSDSSVSVTVGLGRREYYSVEALFDRRYFSLWKGRRGCVSCLDMRGTLGIELNRIFKQGEDLNAVLNTLEFMVNVVGIINSIMDIDKSLKRMNNLVMLVKDIESLLEYLHYQKYEIKEKEQIILVPKDVAATAVAEISSPDTAMAIMTYHHASLKGDLVKKRCLLVEIAREYEEQLKVGVEGCKDYFAQARSLLNNLHIRHNNQIAVDLPATEMEHWYDELYQLILCCVLIEDNKERKERIKEFVRGLVRGNSDEDTPCVS